MKQKVSNYQIEKCIRTFSWQQWFTNIHPLFSLLLNWWSVPSNSIENIQYGRKVWWGFTFLNRKWNQNSRYSKAKSTKLTFTAVVTATHPDLLVVLWRMVVLPTLSTLSFCQRFDKIILEVHMGVLTILKMKNNEQKRMSKTRILKL